MGTVSPVTAADVTVERHRATGVITLSALDATDHLRRVQLVGFDSDELDDLIAEFVDELNEECGL